MDHTAMNCFLSQESVKTHIEHLRQQRLRLSVMEKCYPELLGKDLFAISHLNIDKKIRHTVTELIKNIKSHELFFDSFSTKAPKCRKIQQAYFSVEKLLYDAYELARAGEAGFLYAFIDEKGRINLDFSSDFSRPFIRYQPILALDAFEHTYFADYGFSRDKYIRNALQYWNIWRIEEKLS